MLSSIKNISYLIKITRTFGQYNLLFFLERSTIPIVALRIVQTIFRAKKKGGVGERLTQALKELGPTFIKFGQALSTRSDLLGDETTQHLSTLRDDLAPFNSLDVRQIIEKELNGKTEDFFSNFTWEPVAAASIAQVHFATTNEGKEVAVKVLRPDIEKAFEKDISLLRWLAGILDSTQPKMRRLQLLEVVNTFEETVLLEMDLRLEGAAADELRENFIHEPYFQVPKVFWKLTSQRVLTTERINGIAIDRRETIMKACHDPDIILTRAAAALFKQIFRDGFFHADQHPGNLFVGEKGEIIAVDFGIMGRLDSKTRKYLAEMLISFLNRDYTRVAELHFEAGYVPNEKSLKAFTQACRSIAEPILDKSQNEISIAKLLAQLFQVTKTFNMQTQPQLLLLQKTMLTAEGVGRVLCPNANMWLLAQPLIDDWVNTNISPEMIFNNTITEISNALKRLPVTMANIEKNTSLIANKGIQIETGATHDPFIRKKRTVLNGLILVMITFIILLTMIL